MENHDFNIYNQSTVRASKTGEEERREYDLFKKSYPLRKTSFKKVIYVRKSD